MRLLITLGGVANIAVGLLPPIDCFSVVNFIVAAMCFIVALTI